MPRRSANVRARGPRWRGQSRRPWRTLFRAMSSSRRSRSVRARPGLSAFAVTAFALAACGGKTTDTNEPASSLVETSGARLRLVSWQSEDGFRMAKAELFDSRRNERCRPRAVGEGYRCVPVSTAKTKPAFSDAECARPLAQVVGAALPPKYLLDDDTWRGAERAEQCTKAAPKLYEVASLVSQSTYYSLVNGACVRTTAEPNEFLYSVNEASLDDLAELTLEEERTTERLHRRAWVSADGLRVPTSPIDSAVGMACLLAEGAPNDWICQLNDRVTSELRYTDAACASPVAVSKAACGVPTVVPIVTSDCTLSYRRVGPEQPDTSPRYEMRASSCRAVEPTAKPVRAFSLGESVEPVHLKRGQASAATSRLRATDLLDPTGREFPDPTRRVTDVVAGYECSLVEWPGVGAGCLPRGTGVSHTYFDDAACTVGAKVVSLSGTSCARPLPSTVYDLPTPGSLASRPTVISYTLGARRSRPLYLKAADGKCLDAGPRRMGDTYDVGAVVNESPVAFVKEVIDP